MRVAALLAQLVHDGVSGDDAEIVLAYVCGRERAWVRAFDDAEIGDGDVERVRSLCARRRAGEPVAYLMGSAGFYGRTFAVDARVLVPRPETEHLIDDARTHLAAFDAPRVADIGTGSGAIACTVAAEVPGVRVDAVDISADALAVARANAGALGVAGRIAWFQGDLLAPLAGRRYDAVLANLPYVPTGEIAPRPDPVSFEPRLALDGGKDGLALYRRMLPALAVALTPGGVAYLEAAPPLMAGLAALARAVLPAARLEVGLDYGGRERYLRVRPR